MVPRHAVHILGLCNLVAGALVAGAPHLLMPGAEGLGSVSASLLGTSLGVLLVAIGTGAWLMRPPAVRGYLWLFGVVVKGVGAAVWAMAAVHSGIAAIWIGSVLDLAVAGLIASALLQGRLGEPPLPSRRTV